MLTFVSMNIDKKGHFVWTTYPIYCQRNYWMPPNNKKFFFLLHDWHLWIERNKIRNYLHQKLYTWCQTSVKLKYLHYRLLIMSQKVTPRGFTWGLPTPRKVGKIVWFSVQFSCEDNDGCKWMGVHVKLPPFTSIHHTVQGADCTQLPTPLKLPPPPDFWTMRRLCFIMVSWRCLHDNATPSSIWHLLLVL